MRGVQALVLIEGSADVARETQDLDLWVVPEINAGAASLAYAAINPALGLGSFLAQWLLRRPLMEASTRQFHVTGVVARAEARARRAPCRRRAAAAAERGAISGPTPAPPPVRRSGAAGAIAGRRVAVVCRTEPDRRPDRRSAARARRRLDPPGAAFPPGKEAP